MSKAATLELYELALQICAARLDPSVEADAFSRRVLTLMHKAYAAGAGDAEADEAVAAEAFSGCAKAERNIPENTPGATTGDEAEDIGSAAAEAEDENSGNPPPETLVGRPRHVERPVGGRRLTYDDKVRIRARYDRAIAGRQRPPRKFVHNLAAEYGVSTQTIYNAIKGD